MLQPYRCEQMDGIKAGNERNNKGFHLSGGWVIHRIAWDSCSVSKNIHSSLSCAVKGIFNSCFDLFLIFPLCTQTLNSPDPTAQTECKMFQHININKSPNTNLGIRSFVPILRAGIMGLCHCNKNRSVPAHTVPTETLKNPRLRLWNDRDLLRFRFRQKEGPNIPLLAPYPHLLSTFCRLCDSSYSIDRWRKSGD